MDLRFGLVTLNPFPIGNVSTVRYSSYCKAIAKTGAFAKVYIVAPSKTAAPNKNISGLEYGVLYEYVCKKISWEEDPSFFKKFFYYIFGLFRTALQLRRDKVNCVLLYSSDVVSYVFFWLYSFFYPFCLVTDKSEYPYGYASMGRFGQFFQRLKLKVFDGFVVMTNELVGFYQSVKARNADVFYLPMTVDAVRFENLSKQVSADPYFACAFGVHNRDGLLDTVKAYKLYREKIGAEASRLWLIGDFKNLINKHVVAEYIADEKLAEDVLIKGVLPFKEMPQTLVNAECLITTAREYVSGGFPTKIGEYLLSGTPVVATSAGEISMYLHDREQAFISKPGDVEGISNSLVFVHRNKALASSVADKGRRLALSVFNADSYSDSLVKFFVELGLKKYKRR